MFGDHGDPSPEEMDHIMTPSADYHPDKQTYIDTLNNIHNAQVHIITKKYGDVIAAETDYNFGMTNDNGVFSVYAAIPAKDPILLLTIAKIGDKIGNFEHKWIEDPEQEPGF